MAITEKDVIDSVAYENDRLILGVRPRAGLMQL